METSRISVKENEGNIYWMQKRNLRSEQTMKTSNITENHRNLIDNKPDGISSSRTTIL